MDNKWCGKCDQHKHLSEFYLRKSGEKSGQYYERCKECMKLRGRNYYHINRERQLPLAIKRRSAAYKIKRNFVNTAKDRPCADCGVKYPFYVMDFDHRPGSDKINDVALMTRSNWSLEKIKKEIEKCEVVCANCHRIRTFGHLVR